VSTSHVAEEAGMIRQATLEDALIVDRIFGDPVVWPLLMDDNTPASLRWRVGTGLLESPGVIVLLCEDYATFALVPCNSIMWDVHTAILPAARGQLGIDIGRNSVQWVWDNTGCMKIISWIPDFNRAAILYALKCGFKKEGKVTKSFLKGGRLYDQYVVGIERGVE